MSAANATLLAVDAGTTGVRALLFNDRSELLGSAYREVLPSYPQPGLVEHDPELIWRTVQTVIAAALQQAGPAAAAKLAAVGVANQRSTTVVWERGSGRPVYPAIVWQDGRTSQRVDELLDQGIYSNTMASATKLEWVLRHIPDGFAWAEAGELCFGTIDSWLVWQLSGGAAHVTDHSNASCTGLYDFALGAWDESVLAALQISARMLPQIHFSSQLHATAAVAVLPSAVPIAGIAGDQQAAMFGELNLEAGSIKITYGTSAMVDVHVGDFPVLSQRGAYPLVLCGRAGQRPYCLEGTAITAGAALQWLRDGLGIIADPADSAAVAASVPDSGGVWAVPAFQGLGTPYMDASARAVIGGLSRASTRAHVVRAMLEGIAYRSREVIETLLEDAATPPPQVLRADGGAAANDFLLQALADTLGIPVERPAVVQATALGAAYLAGLAVGVWQDLYELRDRWRCGGRFEPRLSADARDSRFQRWRKALAAAH
ncbi:MAG: glycerol kinase GlpK [Deltaproteobacteria bacterium]|nr:glycerol kinase GlpK [Deltaproteobacteria bacterium]